MARDKFIGGDEEAQANIGLSEDDARTYMEEGLAQAESEGDDKTAEMLKEALSDDDAFAELYAKMAEELNPSS